MAKPSGSKFNSFKKAITSQVGVESEGGSITSKTTHFACNIFEKKNTFICIYDHFFVLVYAVIAVYYCIKIYAPPHSLNMHIHTWLHLCLFSRNVAFRSLFYNQFIIILNDAYYFIFQ